VKISSSPRMRPIALTTRTGRSRATQTVVACQALLLEIRHDQLGGPASINAWADRLSRALSFAGRRLELASHE
jgi:predicted N-formylglutamate amidohydrolase